MKHFLTSGERKKLDSFRERMEGYYESGDPNLLAEIKRDASKWSRANKARRGHRRTALRTIKFMFS